MSEVDISKHELVPKHEIVGEEEKKKLVKKYGPLKLFPKISSSDPQIKLIGAKPGDLVKIIRKDDIIGEYEYYRVVVKR